MNRIKGPAPNNLPRQTVDPNRSGPAPNLLDTAFCKTKGSGFTLIELLVAMSIFAAIAMVLYACFRGGIVSYNRISEEAASQQRLRYLSMAMERDFKNIFLMTNIPFDGDENRILFTTLITSESSTALNAVRVSYYLKGSYNDYLLVRKTESLVEASAAVASVSVESLEAKQSSGLGKEEIIAEGVSGLTFSYLQAEDNMMALEEQEGYEDSYASYEWVGLWQDKGLPAAVRLEILFSGDDGIKPRQVARRVLIPAGMQSGFKTKREEL